MLAGRSQRFPCRIYQSQSSRVQNGPPLTSIEISCVLGRRRRRGWYPVPVQSAGLSSQQIPCFSFIPAAVKANTFFAGSTISGTLSSTRSVTPFGLRIPTNHWCKRTYRLIPRQLPQERKLWKSRRFTPMLVSQRRTSRISKRCSVPTGPRCPSGTNANTTKQTRPPCSAVETLGCIPMAPPASSWMWLWGTLLTVPFSRKPPPPPDEPPGPRRMPQPLIGNRVNAAAVDEMMPTRISHSLASLGDRSP
jgi:hypothetical protein